MNLKDFAEEAKLARIRFIEDYFFKRK